MNWNIAAQSKMVATRFGKLAVRVEGGGDMPPLLLCQRFRGTMEEWDPAFISRLAAGRQVICFDSAGIGESEGETPNTVAGWPKSSRLCSMHWGLTGPIYSDGPSEAMLRRRSH